MIHMVPPSFERLYRQPVHAILDIILKTMKRIRWILTIVGLNSLVLWIVMTPGPVDQTVIVFLIALFFLVPSLGGWWMLYAALRYEKKPFPYGLLALIPFAFLWYYFERYKKLSRSDSLAEKEI